MQSLLILTRRLLRLFLTLNRAIQQKVCEKGKAPWPWSDYGVNKGQVQHMVF